MHDGRAGEASQRVLVHEALSHVVHHEAGVARVRLVAGKVGAAEHDVVGLLLPGAAHPKLHFVAVSGHEPAHPNALIVVDIGCEIAQLDGLGAIALHHVLVMGEVAGCHDDGFGADVFGVGAVGIGRDDRVHATFRAVGKAAANQLLAFDVPAHVYSQVFGHVPPHLRSDMPFAVSDGSFQLAVVNVERVSCGRGEHRVAFFVFRTRLDGGLDAGLGRDVDDPVDGLLGVVVELVPQSRFEVAAVGEVLLAVEPRGIHAGDAHLFHDLRIHAVVGSAAAHRSLRRADERHLQSVFSA